MLLFIPLIPILLVGIGASTIATGVWYSNLTSEEKERENRELARRLRGRRNDDEKKKLS